MEIRKNDNKTLDMLLDEVEREIISRARYATDGFSFIERDVAMQINGGFVANLCNRLTERYTKKTKTVCADGFEEEKV